MSQYTHDIRFPADGSGVCTWVAGLVDRVCVRHNISETTGDVEMFTTGKVEGRIEW